MAVSSIILRIRREGEQAIPATARDLRGLATTAQAAGRALATLQGAQALPNLGGIQQQATALQGLAQGAQQAGQAYAGLAAAQTRASASAPNTAAAAGGIQAVGTSATRAQAGVTTLAVAQQRLATEQQRTALTSQRVATELQRTEAAAARAAIAQQRLAQASSTSGAAIQRNAQGLAILPRTIAGLEGAAAGFARNVAGAFAGAFAVQGIAQFTGEAVRAANQLEDVQSSLRIIARDAGTYDRAIAAATASQRLFGGSLADNISDVQSFVLTSRTAGVALEDLITVSRQLATLDPGQGLRGANIALRELLSGNPNSLAMRFELPRKTLRALTAESATTADKLAALSTFLEDAGLSADAVTGRLDNTSQSFRNLSASAEQAQTSVGALAANALAPLADKSAIALNAVAALAGRLGGQGNQFTQAAAGAAAAADSYEAYRRSVATSNAAVERATTGNIALVQSLPFFGPIVAETLRYAAANQALTETQFAYARALMGQGVAADQAVRQAQAQINTLTTLDGLLRASGGGLEAYREQLIAVSAQGEGQASAVRNLIIAYTEEGISAGQLAVQLANLEASRDRIAAATAEQARQAELARVQASVGADQLVAAYRAEQDAAQEAAAASDTDALAKIRNAAQAELNAERHRDMEQAIRAAATSAEPAAVAASRIANALGLEVDEVLKAINAHRELAAARAGGQGAITVSEREIGGARGAANDINARRLEYERDLQQDIVRATGTTAQQLTLVNTLLAAAPKYSEDAKRLEIEKARLLKQQADERERLNKPPTGGGGGTGAGGGRGLDASFRADLKLEEDAATRLARLEAERQRLEAQGLTNSTRYKQVLVEIKKEQEGIAEAAEKGAAAELNRLQAANRARIAAVEDARKRREEDEQARTAREVLARAEFSPEQKARAQERLQLIELEREQRALAIEEARRAGGEGPAAVATPASLRPLAAPQAAGAPAVGPVALQADAVQLPATLQAQLVQITAAAVQVSGGPVGAAPVQAEPAAPAGVPPRAPVGGQPIVIQLMLDGRELQRVTLPGVVGMLGTGIQAALATGGGG